MSKDKAGLDTIPKLNKHKDTVIISWDFSEGDGVLIVGRQKDGIMQIVNAALGDDARAIVEKLTTIKAEVKKDV